MGFTVTKSIPVPTRTGYTFTGWTKSSGFHGTLSSTTAAAMYTFAATDGASDTITAEWQIITYTITYNGNGSTGGSTASQTKNYGTDINLQQNGFTKTGYHFTGWNTSANGTGTAYAAGAGYSKNADLTLYAQWAPIMNINYKANDLDKNVYNDDSSTSAEGHITSDSILPEETWACKDNMTNVPLGDIKYTKEGYQFAGWNIKSDAKAGAETTSDQNGKQYTGEFIPAGTQMTYEALYDKFGAYEIDLYAVWEPIRYKIIFHGNGNWNEETMQKQMKTGINTDY